MEDTEVINDLIKPTTKTFPGRPCFGHYLIDFSHCGGKSCMTHDLTYAEYLKCSEKCRLETNLSGTCDSKCEFKSQCNPCQQQTHLCDNPDIIGEQCEVYIRNSKPRSYTRMYEPMV